MSEDVIEINIKISLKEIEGLLKIKDVPVIREAAIKALEARKKEIEIKIAKITLMIDALERNDYSNLSESLKSELFAIDDPPKELLLLAERNEPMHQAL
jgi:hypothetical protein